MEAADIGQTARALRDQLLAHPNFPADLALLDHFVNTAPSYGPLDHYKIFTPGAREVLSQVRTAGGETGVRAFLRAAIAHAIVTSLAGPRYAALPARVKVQQLKQFKRMANDTAPDAEWLSLDHDLFRKDFGLALVRLYAAGSRLVDPRCGVPRSLLLRGTPRDWLRCMTTLVELGGFRPYFQVHTHTFMLDSFNVEGSNELYRCCAELYDLHPEVLGAFGASWFYDPAVSSVSPRLSYLREIPESGGARTLYMSTGGEALNNALAKSETRRRLYETGKYVPKIYMIIWGREKQKTWARANPGTSELAA